MRIRLRFRVISVVVAASAAALALVGAGVHAGGETGNPLNNLAFFSHCDGRQHPKDRCNDHPGWPPVTSQMLSVVLSANGATGNGTPNITLGSLGPTGSSFKTAPTLITIANNGTMTATGVALQLSDHDNNATFQHETWVCFYSNGGIFFNEPLTTVEGYGQAAIANITLAPGATDTYTAVYYAGSTEDTGCGAAFTSYHAQLGGGYSGIFSTTLPYPNGTVNPAAASLTNPAEGGSLAPKVTVTYLGSPAAGTITQVPPTGRTVTPLHSDGGFIDHLAVTGSKGTTTYGVTSSNAHLHVSGSGLVATVGGPVAVGTYTVSGAVTDSFGDTGTWTYTLSVIPGTITQVPPKGRTVTPPMSDGGFFDHLFVVGSIGATTYGVTSSNAHLHVSSSGLVTTVGGPLAVGTYTVSGTVTDSFGDTGTWTYALSVAKSSGEPHGEKH